MAKISANTITDGGFSRVAAPAVSPSLFSGAASHIGAALGAGARAIEVENEGIRDLTRQRVANIEARSREMRGAIENLGRGVSGMLKGFDSALDKRADEEAEAAMGKYRLALLAGQAEDDATPVKGSLSVGLGDADAMARADGPYNAVRRRMSAWNDTDDYRNLSARARRKFEERRKAVDQRFGERALEKHIAADLARRDAEAGAAISAAISEASAFACQPDKDDLGWLSSATEAIEQSVKRTLEKAHLLDANGRVAEGAEELAAQVRGQMADMVYSQIFGDMAASLAQTNDQATADKLRMRMYALCGSKAGVDPEKGGFNIEGLDKKQLAEIGELFNKSAKGYEFSDAAAKKGWADFGKAWEARDRRLDAERREAFSEAVDLEWQIFAGGDAGEAAMSKRNVLVSEMPEIDRQALRDKVDGWYFARNLEHYATRIDGLWDMGTPEERKQAADAIEAEVKELDNPKLKAAVRKMMSGLRPASGKIDARMAQNLLVLNDMHGSQAMDWLRDHAGELTKGAFNSVYDFIRADASRIDPRAAMEACKTAGLDLSGIIKTDENGKPLLDEDGNVMLIDPEGTSDIVTESWQEERTLAGQGGIHKQKKTKTRTVKIANDLLGKLFDACVEWQRISSEKKGGAGTLADYVSEHLTGDIKDLTNAVLAEKIAEHGKKMEQIEAANYVIMAGAPIQFREESDEQDGE